jgi:hypothetical protein
MLLSSAMDGYGFDCSMDVTGNVPPNSQQVTLQVAARSGAAAASTVGAVLQITLRSCSSVCLEGYVSEVPVLLPLSASRIRKIGGLSCEFTLAKFIITQTQFDAFKAGNLNVRYKQCRLALVSGEVVTDDNAEVIVQETETEHAEPPNLAEPEAQERVPEEQQPQAQEPELAEAGNDPADVVDDPDAIRDAPIIGWGDCFARTAPTWKCSCCLTSHVMEVSVCICGSWMCHQCSVLHEGTNFVCACGIWKCWNHKCNALNEGTNIVCACGTWKCFCGTLNQGSADVCVARVCSIWKCPNDQCGKILNRGDEVVCSCGSGPGDNGLGSGPSFIGSFGSHGFSFSALGHNEPPADAQPQPPVEEEEVSYATELRLSLLLCHLFL